MSQSLPQHLPVAPDVRHNLVHQVTVLQQRAKQEVQRHVFTPKVALTVGLMLPVLAWLFFANAEGSAWAAPARQSMAVFIMAIVGWTVLRLDDTPVAMAACAILLGLGVITPDSFYATLGDDLIWLLLGAFMLSAVLQQSGLTERWTLRALAGVPNMNALMTRLTWLITATAFIVPSTSGRAALLLPVFVAVATTLNNARLNRALALLFPSVILLSACASPLGAGAHLIALDFMRRLSSDAPSFAGWILLATPFGVASSLLASFVISRLFLTEGERWQPVRMAAPATKPMTRHQYGILAVVVGALLAWATSGWHGIDAALIAMAAGIVATQAKLTGVDMKAALKKVEWNLLLFLAATLAMGQALLETGAAQLLAQALLSVVPLAAIGELGVVALCAFIALVSHVVITSRTARAVVLIPTIALPLAATGIDPAMLVFVTVVGSGFCQTFSVSAKPVTVFAKAEVPGAGGRFEESDLFKLSAVLLLPMTAMLVYFAFVVWPVLGL